MKPLIAAIVLVSGVLALPRAHAQTLTDPADFQAAVDRELAGVAVDGKLDVAVSPDGTATVTYTRSDGRKIVRTVTLPERRDDAIETVALLAGNLVRDQLSGFAEPPATSIAATAPAPAPASAADVPPVRVVPFELGLVPPASTDLVYGVPVAHRFAVGLVAGYGHGVRGVSLAGAVDVQDGSVEGVQVAGALDVVRGPERGVQIAGPANVATGRVAGVQVAGALNVAADDVRGLQIAGAANVATGRVAGVQLAGALNVADESSGAQIAPFNVARRAHGLQLGVVNYGDADADDGGLSIGVFSIVRHGLTEVDAAAESYGGLSITLRHGRRRFYNLYGAATTSTSDGDAEGVQMAGLGFGSRLGSGEIAGAPVDVDVDLMGWSLSGNGVVGGNNVLGRLRLGAAVGFGHVAVFAGVAANCFVADQNEQGDALHPELDRSWRRDDVTTRLWPSLYAGIRVQ
jgi:hypothetical protein